MLYLCTKVTTFFPKTHKIGTKTKIKQDSKKYFEKLILAQLGKDPFRCELDSLRNSYEKASEKIASLNDLYFEVVDKYDAIKKLVADKDAQVESLQGLVENLRQRIAEKDELMRRLKSDYQARIEEYTKEIDSLKNEN